MKKNLSQLKRQRQNEKQRIRNRALTSQLRLSVRGAREAIATEPEAAETEKKVKSATRTIDKMVTKGLLKKQTAGRYKSRIMKQYSSVSSVPAAPAAAPEIEPAPEATPETDTETASE